MREYVLSFQQIDRTNILEVGGKGANLGELAGLTGIQVPDGFCVTTEAYKEIINRNQQITGLLDELSQLKVNDRNNINAISSKIRREIENTPIPYNIVTAIENSLARFTENDAFAVRSSATAEDLPFASFAGQQDTYLNIIGRNSILKHINKCWASLFTERAVTYRIQNEFDHQEVFLSVVVQKMIFPKVSGIMFTADPVTSNRKVLSIDASFGLGEALVSGIVNADNYKVRSGEIIDKQIPAKKLAIYPLKAGGTKQQEIESEKQTKQALTNAQILQLERMGRNIEAYFGNPQDIEWCLADDIFYIVQSRPITTLFPIPETNDKENHVYVSTGHQQMMTDAIKPLGLSVWMLTGGQVRFTTAAGRLFVDITMGLSTPAGRQNLLGILGHNDPLIKDALITITERADFIKSNSNDETKVPPIKSHHGMSAADIQAEAGNDPAIVTEIINHSKRSISALKQKIQARSGLDVFDCILEDMQQRRQMASDLKSLNVIMAAVHASAWINEKMNEWLGEKNVADILTLSVPNNITSEMGMDLLDLSDTIRPYPEIVEYLRQAKNDNILEGFIELGGGQLVHDAFVNYLNKYGMRCAGEIDITRTRWSEKPAILVPMILSNINNLEAGAGKRKFEQGRQQALNKERDLIARLKQLPGGGQKAEETKQMIDLLRNFIGYREYPKYDVVNRYFIYKQSLLREAEQLVKLQILHEKEDIYYLSFEELQETVRIQKLDYQLINKRKEEYKIFEKLTPPRVITSDGEIITGRYQLQGIPDNAIAGLAVSSGVVEGRARVILNIDEADMEEGDILITTFTDPSWTPLFLSIKGLVTEVGGLMTHGAVIAREYGLPAVVGVENATKLIRDKQRIRINGTDGYIEFL